MTTIYKILILILCLPTLHGCVNLKPAENTARFYVLGARDHATEPLPTTQGTEGLSIGIRKLRLAAYLDTPYIVIRHGANEVSFSENYRWGEDLPLAITRTVESYLRTQDGIHRVEAAPWPINVEHDYIIQIHILQFEGHTDTTLPKLLPKKLENQEVSVHLVATWQIIDPESGDVIHQENTDVMLGGWKSDIYTNLVSGLDDTLQAMAQNIALAVKSL